MPARKSPPLSVITLLLSAILITPSPSVAAPLDPMVPERSFSVEVLIEDSYGIDGVTVEQDGAALEQGRVTAAQ